MKGIMRWMVIGLQFYGLQWLWEKFMPATSHNLWLEKIWIAIIAFLMFSVLKYVYHSFLLTKPYLTFKDVE